MLIVIFFNKFAILINLNTTFMKKLLLFMCVITQSIAFGQGSCATASPVTAGTYLHGVINGTYQPGCFPASTAANPVTSGLWYSFTSATQTVVRVNTNIAGNPASGDSRISIYDGTCGALVCVNSSDDISTTNYLTDLSFLAEAGVIYYIQFDNRWAADANNLSFEISTVAAPCNSSVPFNEVWANQFTCWRVFNTDANALTWAFNNGNDVNGDAINDPIALIFPVAATNGPKNDWLISNGIALTAGSTYEIEVVYNGFSNPLPANESFRVVMLDSKSPTAVFNEQIGSESGIVQSGATVSNLLTEGYTSTYGFTPASSGNYHVGIHSNTPAAAGIFMLFTVSLTEILSTQDFFANNLKIYPNPARDIITISSSTTVIHSIQLTDLNGRLVKSYNLNGVSDAELTISDIQAGLYFVSVETELGKGVTKIVKN